MKASQPNQASKFDSTIEREPSSSDEQELPNWPGCEFPLACRVLREGDEDVLHPVITRSAHNIKRYFGWAKYADGWDPETTKKFVDEHVDQKLPRFHLIFSIGHEVVGFGSLAPVSKRERDIQVAIWVAQGWESQGIGSWMTTVLEWYSFHVFGYDHVFYQHDTSNQASSRIPRKLGYRLSHTFIDKRGAQSESGLWLSWLKKRPDNLAPGVIDTGNWGQWPDLDFPWKSLV